jgi:N utilization substance protein B
MTAGTTRKPSREDARLARSAARLAAVQALYQMEVAGTDLATVRREFETHRIGAEIEGAQYREADIDLFRDLIEGAVRGQARIDQLTDRALVEKWPLGRIDTTLRALFRAAGHELTGRPDIPPKVVIGEYVDIAKAFFSGKEPGFVNGVLDHMARSLNLEIPFFFAAQIGHELLLVLPATQPVRGITSVDTAILLASKCGSGQPIKWHMAHLRGRRGQPSGYREKQ